MLSGLILDDLFKGLRRGRKGTKSKPRLCSGRCRKGAVDLDCPLHGRKGHA